MTTKMLSALASALALAACASGAPPMAGQATLPAAGSGPQFSLFDGPTAGAPRMHAQAGVPEAIRVPAGHRVAMETVGVGQLAYDCRANPAMPGSFEWAFAGPDATLADRGGRAVGKYYGPPATWQSSDGSRITGTQLAVSPAGAGSIPLQLVKANPATGSGAMQGVTYIQRLATRGGAAPATVCDASRVGNRALVAYQADYIFWKSA